MKSVPIYVPSGNETTASFFPVRCFILGGKKTFQIKTVPNEDVNGVVEKR